MNNHTKPNSRRNFLLNTTLGGAGAAVAVVAGRKVASGGETAPAADAPHSA